MSKTPRELTEERGQNYGHPYDQFQTAQKMYEVWRSRRGCSKARKIPEDVELCSHHAAYLILTKLSRAAHNPMHLDDWRDIQGFAQCMMDSIERSQVKDRVNNA